MVKYDSTTEGTEKRKGFYRRDAEDAEKTKQMILYSSASFAFPR